MMLETKEKTAPIPSVGAEEGQPVQNLSVDSIPISEPEINGQIENSEKRYEELCRKMQQMSNPNYLPVFSLTELYETVYQSRPPVIDGLLYTGTYLLAGAPKVGKSFLVGQLAYHISNGKPLWDYPVHRGAVLYFALEDDKPRLQQRMSRMFGVQAQDKLLFSVVAKQLGNGLEGQMEDFVREHPDTKLIIIDTLQKIRESCADTYSYANDYEIIGKLKAFSDKHGICILVVHHTRKQPAGDKFEMISGTTGLLGCADGAFVLQKEKSTDHTATLDAVGRDQGDQRLYLVRDEKTLAWQLDHAETERWKEPPDPLLDAVAALVKAEWSGTPTELRELLAVDLQPNTLTKHLNVNAGRLFNEYGIQYENTRTHAGRKITLTPASAEA